MGKDKKRRKITQQPMMIEDIYPEILSTLKKKGIPYLMGYLPEIEKFTRASLSDPDNWQHFLDVILSVKPKLVYVNPWEFDEEAIERLADFIINEQVEFIRKRNIQVKEQNIQKLREQIISKIRKKYKKYYEKYERLTISYVMDNVFHNISIIPLWAENMFYDAIEEAEKELGGVKKSEDEKPAETEIDLKKPKLYDIYR